ncbi:outer membrane beta-barrel protein [Vibrio metschnikovii]|uniref:outer membrane beta-barrel protein n=1 Tax=Vibrio metschnikovii TaxID=28172 RepID=UPI001C3003D7|nr:outer membrane beta-barrel protein [Vibrio metschnikovii]
MLGMLYCSLFSNVATAEWYSGLSGIYSNSEHQELTEWQDASPLLAQVQLGYFFSDYIAIEARHTASIERDSGLSIDGLSSVLIKANMPITARVALYTLGGYSYISTNYRNQSHYDDGISFGVGVHYALSSTSAVTSEWINYLTGDDVRLSGLQLGIQFRF